MEGHSQLANCVRGKTMALFKPWRYLVPKLPNLDVAKEARVLCAGNDKGDKIKRDIMINDYSNGGLKMLDIESFSRSLKATWIKKYLDKENRGKWKLFFDLELEKSGGATVLTSNLNTKDTIQTLKINNQFISEVLTIWAEVNFEEEITSESQFLDQSLWHNSLIRISNHPIFLSRMVAERCFTSETFERWLKLFPILN